MNSYCYSDFDFQFSRLSCLSDIDLLMVSDSNIENSLQSYKHIATVNPCMVDIMTVHVYACGRVFLLTKSCILLFMR